MVEAASLGLANALTSEEISDDLIYPRIERIRDISANIAVSVIQAAQREVCFQWFQTWRFTENMFRALTVPPT